MLGFWAIAGLATGGRAAHTGCYEVWVLVLRSAAITSQIP